MVLTFDLTNIDTFMKIRDWIASVFNFKERDLPMVLVGNKLEKCDSNSEENKRQVETEAAEELAARFDIAYFETSSK